jgi:hypothetical protein
MSIGRREMKNSLALHKITLHVEPRALLLHSAFPLPFLPALVLHAAINPPQLERHAWPNLLHAHLDILYALDRLAVRAGNGFLGLALVPENISMPSYEDVIALVV